MTDPVIDLVVHINEALSQSDFPTPENGYFASKSTLTAITEPSIAYTIWPDLKLDETLVDSERELIEFISEQARELFAIGIYMEIQKLGDMMQLFRRHGITDKSLPISDDGMETMWPGVRYKGRRRSFKDSQHLFRPQSFRMQDRFSVIQLESKVVLPVLQSTHISQGQFGIVYKVVLHEDFLDLNNPIRKVRQSENHLLQHKWHFCVVFCPQETYSNRHLSSAGCSDM